MSLLQYQQVLPNQHGDHSQFPLLSSLLSLIFAVQKVDFVIVLLGDLKSLTVNAFVRIGHKWQLDNLKSVFDESTNIVQSARQIVIIFGESN